MTSADRAGTDFGSYSGPRDAYRIDLHTHFLPAAYHEYLSANSNQLGAFVPPWSADSHIAFMDTWHIQKSVVGVSQPFYFGDLAATRAVARAVNDAGRELLDEHSDRFAVHVTLPLPDVAASIEELSYGFDDLKLDAGVVLFAQYGGVYLGDPAYDDLYSELDRRGCVVWLHPGLPTVSLGPFPNYVLEFPFETTRAAANIIYKGLPERYPNIKWQLAHAGGALPYILFRLASLQVLPFSTLPQTPAEGPFGSATTFYYDTAVAGSPEQLLAVDDLAGPSKLVFGTDWPYTTPMFAPDVNQKFPWFSGMAPNNGDPEPGVSAVFNPEQRLRIERTNALQLYPNLVPTG